MSSREQVAVAKFAQCLQVIPKTLAINAALDASELVSKVNYFYLLSELNSYLVACLPQRVPDQRSPSTL